jgi:putative nucleotidyltransferase with HDIG domain
VLLATAAVVLLPALLIWWLRVHVVGLPVVWLVLLSAVLAVGSSHVGVRVWERRPRSDGRLFADLMLWGWLRRWRLERRIATVVSALGLERGGVGPAVGGPGNRLELLQTLVCHLEARDPYMHGHSRRVARYSSLVAARLGLHGDKLGHVRLAAALHDLGKLRTPTAILHKPGGLTDEEYAVVKQHAATGARMIEALADDAELAATVRHHHERLDGTGYPDGLQGESIPLASRIIAVADTFDALTADRPYRSARPHKVALDILRAEAGTQLDGDVVTAFQSVYASKWQVGVVAAALSTGVRSLANLLSGAPAAAMQVAGVAAAGAAAGLAPAVLVKQPAPVQPQVVRPAGHPASAPLGADAHPVRSSGSGTRVQAQGRRRLGRPSSGPRHLAAQTGGRDTAGRTTKRAAAGPTGTPSSPANGATGSVGTTPSAPTPSAPHPAALTPSAPSPFAPTSSRPPVSASAQASGSGAAASVQASAPPATATIGGSLNHNGASVKVGVTAGPLAPPISTTVSVPLPPLPRPPAAGLPPLTGK